MQRIHIQPLSRFHAAEESFPISTHEFLKSGEIVQFGSAACLHFCVRQGLRTKDDFLLFIYLVSETHIQVLDNVATYRNPL